MTTLDKVGVVVTGALLGGVVGFILGVFVQAHFEEKNQEVENEKSTDEKTKENKQEEAEQNLPPESPDKVEQTREPVRPPSGEKGERTEEVRNYYHGISKKHFPTAPRDEVVQKEEEVMIHTHEEDEDGFEIVEKAVFDDHTVFTNKPEGFGVGAVPIRRYFWLSDVDVWVRFTNGNHVSVPSMPFPDSVVEYCIDVLTQQELPAPVFVVSSSGESPNIPYIIAESSSDAVYGFKEDYPQKGSKREEEWS